MSLGPSASGSILNAVPRATCCMCVVSVLRDSPEVTETEPMMSPGHLSFRSSARDTSEEAGVPLAALGLGKERGLSFSLPAVKICPTTENKLFSSPRPRTKGTGLTSRK